jgi:membrane protein YdbS with pleckstrin-like domain
MTKQKQAPASPRERGTWLSLWLILILLHGIFASGLIWYLRAQRSDPSPSWMLAILFVLAIADIVAAVAAWYWKKWGLWLYTISTVIGIVVGLVLTASQLIVFHDIIPLAILGYLVRNKWGDFV